MYVQIVSSSVRVAGWPPFGEEWLNRFTLWFWGGNFVLNVPVPGHCFLLTSIKVYIFSVASVITAVMLPCKVIVLDIFFRHTL